eukprot:IDg2372t1
MITSSSALNLERRPRLACTRRALAGGEPPCPNAALGDARTALALMQGPNEGRFFLNNFHLGAVREGLVDEMAGGSWNLDLLLCTWREFDPRRQIIFTHAV